MHEYNVGGTLPDGVFLTITVHAHNAKEAIAKAKIDEPELDVKNIVRTLVAREEIEDA